MRMEGQDESDNVEDMRDAGGGGGGGFGFIGGRGIGLGTIAVALVAGWFFGINPLTVLSLLSGGGGGAPMVQPAPQHQGPAHKPPAGDPAAHFVSQILRSTEVVWGDIFQQAGQTYRQPKLVLFRHSIPTGCGQGQAAMGPFYCPADEKVYIDLSFYDVLRGQLGAPGEFAQAYVVAHEVGHHVQKLLGISDKVDAMRRRQSQAQANATSVRLELQADCFAGVWASRSQSEKGWRLDEGDVEQALNAASQIGDDTLQRRSQGTVVPESFTHGTSAQRVGWFKRGMQGADIKQCDTFEARDL